MNLKEMHDAELALAEKTWCEAKGNIENWVPYYDGALTAEGMLVLDSLIRKGIIIPNPPFYKITSETKRFIENKGYTNEELARMKDDKRKDRTLLIAALALIVSVVSMVMTLLMKFGIIAVANSDAKGF